jgi:RNA polymerase sporulation-specific sigma factor
VEQKIQSENIKENLHILNPREQRVLELRYGIHNGVKETQRDIARILGISRSYVSRIENKALKKMIARLGNPDEEPWQRLD